jgi:hypothetical protein
VDFRQAHAPAGYVLIPSISEGIVTEFESQCASTIANLIRRFTDGLEGSAPLTLPEYLAPRVGAAIQAACAVCYEADRGGSELGPSDAETAALRVLGGDP